jgi:hypothetical protein
MVVVRFGVCSTVNKETNASDARFGSALDGVSVLVILYICMNAGRIMTPVKAI